MRILIDLQGAQNGSKDRGIGRYCLALAKAIARNRGQHEVFVLVSGLFDEDDARVRRELEGLIPAGHIVTFKAAAPVDEFLPGNAWRCRAGEVLYEHVVADISPDIFLIGSLFEGGCDNTITSVGRLGIDVPTAVILYDLIPLIYKDKYLGNLQSQNWYFRKIESLKRADLLLAISQSARHEAIHHLDIDPSRVIPISSAADSIFTSSQLAKHEVNDILLSFGITDKFVMHSSAYDERKNFEGLIKAFGLLPSGLRMTHQLVLVCKLKHNDRAALMDLASQVGVEEGRLILTGFVSDKELIALYSSCHLFVFPSFHEGFGLPILEAMSCGAPAIGSNSSSIPEVIGREDALFDPNFPSSIAAMIEKVLTDSSFWSSLKKHSMHQATCFSWDRSALAALDGFEAFQRSRKRTPQLPVSHSDLGLISAALRSIRDGTRPTEMDLAATAASLLANQDEVLRLRAQASFSSPLTWRVEGPFDSTYSLALLNRETARSLDRYGHRVVLHSTEGPGDFPANPAFLSANHDLARMHLRVADVAPDMADVLSRNLYPPRVNDMSGPINLLHHYAWEESGFPAQWVEEFNSSLQGITCLSEHVEKILIDHGVTVPLLTSGCGVDHWERITASSSYEITARTFRFLHVSSCFPRKGVEALLDAYGDVFTIQDDVSLVIKTFPNPHNLVHEWLEARRANNESYPHVVLIEGDISDQDLKALYGKCHVLIAPSSAEGFGLPMAEAMLTGLPVITTAWGGQLDFCTVENAWLVDYSFERARTHFHLPGSVWASVDVAALGGAIAAAYRCPPETRRRMADRGRRLLLQDFTWDKVVARAVNAVKLFSSSATSTDLPRIAWLSTWNTKCGVASYSSHLVAQMEVPVTVLAPRQQPLDATFDDCVRCWNSGKDDNGLAAVSREVTQLGANVIVVQFNYGFYNFEELARFLEDQVDSGRVVIVMFHSTVDPTELATGKNWELKTLANALSRCDRLLVHSVADLNRLKSLSLVDNVAVFPHGAPTFEANSSRQLNTVPLIAAYGFCLPHKGLLELIRAAAILRDKRQPIRLKLVNALYPVPVSEQLGEEIQALIKKLSLEAAVDFYWEYLEEGESVRLLQEADLLIFPYQQTGESSSAAVRTGLATGVPIAVTPVAIFDDVSDVVHKLPGAKPEDMAEGIQILLAQLREESQPIEEVREKAEQWRRANSHNALARRLTNMSTALLRRKVKLSRTYFASSPELNTQVGTIAGQELVSTSTSGFLLFGPYIEMPAGRYFVHILGSANMPDQSLAFADVTVDHGQTILNRAEVATGVAHGTLFNLEVLLEQPCKKFEIRVWVDSQAEMRLAKIDICEAVDAA